MAVVESIPPQSQPQGYYKSISFTLLLGFLFTVARYCLAKLWRARERVRKLQREGYPIPPGHSWLFGHLLYLKQYIDKLPPGAHYQYAFRDIGREQFYQEGHFYVDLWPVTGIMMVNFSPNISAQILQGSGHVSVNRPGMLKRFFLPIAGGPNLFDLGEKEWRPWRAVFNKGFSNEHVFSLIPGMIEETLTYCSSLHSKALERNIFSLDATTLRFTMDLIGKTVLNTSLNAQKGYNALADSMISTIRWQQANAESNPFSHFNFVRRYIHWSNGRRMDSYIGKLLDERYKALVAEAKGSHPVDARSKSVMDLVLRTYIKEKGAISSLDGLDAEFRTFAIHQIRLFLFAGHDSTGSSICYAFYLLSQNKDKLQKLRTELSDVFGYSKSSEDVAQAILSTPTLLNSLTYTTAVVKESLRLFPPAGSVRQGFDGESIINDVGKSCSIDDISILTIHTELQRNSLYWADPDFFIPERFLAKPGEKLYPPKNAWRPFEKGPRNCPAEGLVTIEMKVVLAIVAGEFDFEAVYDELDAAAAKHRDPKKLRYRGERAYQIEEGAAHPCEGMPVRVKKRVRS